MAKEILVEQLDVRDKIVAHLKNDDRSLRWMCGKITEAYGEKNSIPYATLYSCLHQKLFKISEENLVKINTVLGTNF